MSVGETIARGAVAKPRGGAQVTAEALRREHGHRIVALAGVDLEIEAGAFVALTGPSGSGKTTLLSLVGGLDRPTSGHVVVDGLALHSASESERARYHRDVVGFVFQHHHLLLHLTARANVELPLLAGRMRRSERVAQADGMLEEMELRHRGDELTAHLSGGERQRVAVARALARRPRLLLADEPTGALDTAAAERVLGLLEQARDRRGMTLLVVTHDPLVASRADRVLHLRDGRLVDEPPRLRPGGEQLGA